MRKNEEKKKVKRGDKMCLLAYDAVLFSFSVIHVCHIVWTKLGLILHGCHGVDMSSYFIKTFCFPCREYPCSVLHAKYSDS